MPGYGEADIIQELEAQIARLTAEQDDYKAHFEVCNANRQRLDDRVRYLEEQLEKVLSFLRHTEGDEPTGLRLMSITEIIVSALSDPILSTRRRE